MYTYGWFMLMFGRNQHNSVIILQLKKKNKNTNIYIHIYMYNQITLLYIWN